MAEGGTLSQLRHLINRTNVPAKPKQNVNAAEDFFETVVVGHVIAAALDFFEMDNMDAVATSDVLSQIDDTQEIDSKRKLFHSAMTSMVKKYINITPFMKAGHKESDQVRSYAREVLSLGVLLLEFNDAIREGDGERLLRAWKFLLIIFRASNKKKYSLEGLLLLIRAKTILPPRLQQQLMYSRFVNTRGRPGKNIPMDLHVEHVNRLIKTAIYHQVSNLSQSAVIRTSRCLGSFSNITEQFDHISGLHNQSIAHSEAKLEKDISRIVMQLHSISKVFNCIPKRQHSHFKFVNSSMMNNLKTKENEAALFKWMEGHLKKAASNL